MADPSQSFRDFERAGWEDARVVELYEQHLSPELRRSQSARCSIPQEFAAE